MHRSTAICKIGNIRKLLDDKASGEMCLPCIAARVENSDREDPIEHHEGRIPNGLCPSKDCRPEMTCTCCKTLRMDVQTVS